MTLDEGHYYIYFCCGNVWKSKFMALEKPGKLRDFFLLLYGQPVQYRKYCTREQAVVGEMWFCNRCLLCMVCRA